MPQRLTSISSWPLPGTGVGRSTTERVAALQLTAFTSGASRIRTGDIRLAKTALYQLSYGPREQILERPGAQISTKLRANLIPSR